jgi:dTDP-4-dehydrorhamnose 3,5-epimerase
LKFEDTPISGVSIVSPELLVDERGFFARTWCGLECSARGAPPGIVQASISHNRRAGTLRGMHFSWPPSREFKLVRCERGCIFDVVIDLRPDSPTFARHFAIELTAKDRAALLIPPGLAHGFQTLADDSDVLYMMTDYYRAELADGVRYDDPAFDIQWPRPVTTILERDRIYRDFDAIEHRRKFDRSMAAG